MNIENLFNYIVIFVLILLLNYFILLTKNIIILSLCILLTILFIILVVVSIIKIVNRCTFPNKIVERMYYCVDVIFTY